MLAQYIVSGLASGAVYAVVAIGIVLIYRASGVINFAHGEVAALGTFVVYSCWTAGVPIGFAIVIGMALSAVISPLIEAVALGGLRNRTHLNEVMVTVALFLGINGLTLALFGSETHNFPALVTGSPIVLGNVVISRQTVLVLGFTIFLSIGLSVLFKTTRLGIAMRAVSESRTSAVLAGLPVRWIIWGVWAAAGITGVAAGVLIAPIVYLNVNMMIEVLIKAFAGAVVGGLTSINGAIVGSLLLGIGESLLSGYVSSQLTTPFTFLVLVLALVVRPQGLFGRTLEVKL